MDARRTPGRVADGARADGGSGDAIARRLGRHERVSRRGARLHGRPRHRGQARREYRLGVVRDRRAHTRDQRRLRFPRLLSASGGRQGVGFLRRRGNERAAAPRANPSRRPDGGAPVRPARSRAAEPTLGPSRRGDGPSARPGAGHAHAARLGAPLSRRFGAAVGAPADVRRSVERGVSPRRAATDHRRAAIGLRALARTARETPGIASRRPFRHEHARAARFVTERRAANDALIVAALVIAVAIAYAPVRRAEFINLDDFVYVTGNPWVRRGLSWSGAAWALTSTELANWHPLTWLSHMLDVTVFGMRPGAHHATSVLL